MHRAALLALALAGCISHTETGPPLCRSPMGTYRLTQTRRSGTCPAMLPEQIAQLTGTPAYGPDTCVWHNTLSGDGCDVQMDMSCPAEQLPGHTVVTRGVVHWSQDGSSASGEVQIELSGPMQNCQGVYVVSYVKI